MGADFGFAKRVTSPKSLTTQCGSPLYIAPEIIQGLQYDEKVDCWSVGIILFILLGGYPPFNSKDQSRLLRKIRRGSFEFKEEFWGNVSKEAKNLISSLLVVNPDSRMSASQALKNTWIIDQAKSLKGRDLGVSLVEFKKFNAKRKLLGSVHTVMLAARMAKKMIRPMSMPPDSAGKRMEECYNVGKELGRGAFSAVHRVQ